MPPSGQMPGVLRDTKLTDFFQRRSSLLGSGDTSSSPLQSSIRRPSQSINLPSIPTVAKRKSGRPRGSGKSTKTGHQRGHGVSASSSQSLYPRGTGDSISAPGPSPLRLSNSSPPVKRRPGRPKGIKKKATEHSQDAYLSHSSCRAGSRNTVLPLNSASHHRGMLSSPLSSSPPTSTPSKRKFDDDDDAVSVTSSGVPLSLYYNPRQPSSQGLSKPRKVLSPKRGLSSFRVANKRPRHSPPRSPHSLRHPVTPVRGRRNEEVVPTSQPDEVGLYSPVRLNASPRRKSAVHENVENWRHGRSAYKFETVSPLRFAPEGDYSMEIDRPLSPLTSCPHSLTLGSPLSSFSELDTTFPEAELNMLPPLSQHALPSPASSSAGRPTFAQIATPPSVRPVTPPPSSPEQEQPTPEPVAPKDSKMKTAEIIKEIWASVRAKSTTDSEDSCLHAPISDELSSEEEDDEPFWKNNKTLASHTTQTQKIAGVGRIHSLPSLPSPSSPSPSPSPDELSPVQHRDHRRHVPDFPRTRTQRTTARPAKTLTRTVNLGARKVDPIKSLLRERTKESRTGGGIDVLNSVEGYDHTALLSDFSVDEADEPVDGTTSGGSGLTDENIRADAIGRQSEDANVVANTLEEEVHKEERERLLGAKEGEAVGRILDADRKLGQIPAHDVLGVAAFNNYETMDTEAGNTPCPIWESAEGKTTTLTLLGDAIGRQDVDHIHAVFRILSAEDMMVPGVAQWLCEQALWNENGHLGRFSRTFLLEMPLWAQSYPGSPLTVDLIVHTLMRLGLDKNLGAYIRPIQDATYSRLRNRSIVLGTMVKMISSFDHRWTLKQLPDIIVVLLLIGIDMGSSTELRRDILHSVSLLCCQLPTECGEEGAEISVAERVLDLAGSLSPSNQALLLSFFARGSPSCLRIARAVANHVLIDSAIQPASYALPPLGPLISVLSHPDGPFSVRDSTDYDALTSRIAVLGIALSGIESYVAEESMLRKTAQAAMPEGSPRKKEPLPLELVRARLDAMHGKIFDTRAAHLDRSRAKGAIQRLSMRVHYQRAALSKTGGQLRLGDFFSPFVNSRQPTRKNRS
ncbi:hypothetical protein EDB86DRAFT_2957228 [Lactarius hatsudake]|nr:hypothetical protein EDB86DRAFT_2957228 [Lactarius hatsudake]